MSIKQIIAIYCIIGLLPLGLQAQDINKVDSQNRKQGKWIRKDNEGRATYEGFFVNDKPVGEFIRYHKNGKVRAKQLYAEGADSCYVELFLENGDKTAEGGYVNERKSGQWKYYGSNKEVILTESYRYGTLNGESIRYYADGVVLEKSSWAMGKQQGVYSRHFENGALNFEMVYTNDVPNGPIRHYYPNGALKMEGAYKNGLRDGKWITYSENGKDQKAATYVNGVADNEAEELIKETEWLNSLESKKGTISEPDESSIRIR